LEEGNDKPKDVAKKKIVDYIKKSPELKRKLFQPDTPIRVSLNCVDEYDGRERTFTVDFSPGEAQIFFDLARESAQDAQEFFFEQYGYTPAEISNTWWSIIE
jgi:hypothetical protein